MIETNILIEFRNSLHFFVLIWCFRLMAANGIWHLKLRKWNRKTQSKKSIPTRTIACCLQYSPQIKFFLQSIANSRWFLSDFNWLLCRVAYFWCRFTFGAFIIRASVGFILAVNSNCRKQLCSLCQVIYTYLLYFCNIYTYVCIWFFFLFCLQALKSLSSCLCVLFIFRSSDIWRLLNTLILYKDIFAF